MKKLLPLLIASLLSVSSFTFAADTQTDTNNEPSTLDKIGTVVNDSAITTTIVAKYSVDSLLGPFKIDVNTEKGVVTLSGKVDSETQYERALTLASETEGVTRVDASHLKVAPSESVMSDSYVTTKVKSSLFKNQIIDGDDVSAWDVHVETNNGVVFLTGEVPNEADKQRVIDIVNSVEGVKKVEADLNVVK